MPNEVIMPDTPTSTKTMRSPLARAERFSVDREARRIAGAAVITRGEALGHGLWIDGPFLDSVVAAGNGSPKGLKARWTHPGMFGDGMGTYLGRITNLSRDGDVVRGDLQISETASTSPIGDLGAYVLSLASEDPEAFGLSIVFDRDIEAEISFSQSNLDASGNFRSPDAGNTGNLEHARLSTLFGADIVDEPAANPKGLFATLAEYLSKCGPFKFVLGEKMSNEIKPETAPELEAAEEVEAAEEAAAVCPECGQAMPDGNPEDKPAEESAEAKAEESPEEEKPEDEMSERVGAIEAGLAELKAMVSELAKPKPAGTNPVGFGGEPSSKDFMQLAREYATASKCDLVAAMKHISKTNPEAHRRYIGR